MLAAQVPRRPERWLRTDESAHVERLMRQRAGAAWVDTDDFTVSVEGNRRAMQVAGVAHSALEYYRWAVRSQVRAEGRRFAAAVDRPPTVPVLQVHGADDPYLTGGHRRGVAALGRPAPAVRAAPRDGALPARGATGRDGLTAARLPPALTASARAAQAGPGSASRRRPPPTGAGLG